MKPRLAILSALLAATLAVGCAGNERQLSSRLDAALNRLASSGAVLHARVIELPSRHELYARNADAACVPASNYKLLTSAAGLDLFGADYRMKTYLAMDGDDLWIVGTGDPGTGDSRLAKVAGGTPITMLDEWVKVLEQRGIQQINGDLIYDDGVFERELQVHTTWAEDWLLQWYAAPVAGLNFNDNCVDITVHPTEQGKPARYEVMPPVENIRIVNECITRKDGKPTIVKQHGGNVYKLGGGCSVKTELISKPVDDPGAFFADALRVHLKSHGIEVAGRIRRADAHLGGTIPPPAAKVVAVHETPMRDILSRCNKNSQNLFAECLCKMIGRECGARGAGGGTREAGGKVSRAVLGPGDLRMGDVGGRGQSVPGSWENGGKAMRAFLRRNGIDDAALVPVDGSGLSPANRTTTRMLTELLAVMYSRPDGEAYRASLSAAGVDGSLKSRMPDLIGFVFGKTGYIGGVSSLSGYIKIPQGRWLAFAFIYNNCPAYSGSPEDVEPFTKLQDEACKILVEWP